MANRIQRPVDQDEIDEGPSPEDIEAFGDVTRECPKCKAEMYDDVEICWKCGHILSRADTPGNPKWVVAVAVVVLAVIILMMIR